MKLLIILSLTALAWSKPREVYEPAIQTQIISEGPWVTDAAWEGDVDNRDPKGIMDNVPSFPSPTALLGRLGSWWDWDR